MEKTERLAVKIKELRKSLGLTQAELARKIGVHPHTIADYEAGRRRPTVMGFGDLAAALGVSQGELLDEGSVAPLMMPMEFVAKRIASIPDDIYEKAEGYGPKSDVWELVRGVFEVYERDLEDRAKDVKKG